MNHVGRTSLSVFPETVRELDAIKQKTGANKIWIVRILVKRELKRLMEEEKNGKLLDLLEVGA